MKGEDPQSEWFEISDDYWLDPGETRPKLRLLADHNVPIEVVRECRRAKLDIKTAADLGVHRLDDQTLYDYCRKGRLALLTGDEGFWRKGQYRPEKGGYVIVVSVPNSRHEEFLRAFGLFFGAFGRSFGGRLTKGLRVLAKPRSFFLEMIALSGSRVQYELKIERGVLWAREL
jgi:hypothetical protein